MYLYSTLENVSNETLYTSFLKGFEGFRITKEASLKTFCEMLKENDYDASISIGAFDEKSGELVGFVLNSLKIVDNRKVAYTVLTATHPACRRQGIASNVFRKAIQLLKNCQIEFYTTEVLKHNIAALEFYKKQGFEIIEEITSDVTTDVGSRKVEQYKIELKL